jgi:hypothetical protein
MPIKKILAGNPAWSEAEGGVYFLPLLPKLIYETYNIYL